MILVDTSVWVDHLRRGDARLVDLLNRGMVLMHPFIVGEIALGSLTDRALIIESMHALPAAAVAEEAEVLTLIESRALHGGGIGYVDAHLLASVVLMPGTQLWTRDKKLNATAGQLGLAWDAPASH